MPDPEESNAVPEENAAAQPNVEATGDSVNTEAPPQDNTEDAAPEKKEETREEIGGFADAVKEDDPESSEDEKDGDDSDGEDDGKLGPVVFDIENVELPDNMEVPPEIAEEMGRIATEEGFTAEQSDSLMKLGVKYQAQVSAKQSKITEDFIFDLRKQCRADPDIAGENGANYKQTMINCKKAILSAGGAELFKTMQRSPVIFVDDPNFIKVMNHYAKLTGEDISPTGDTAKSQNILDKYKGLM